MWIVAALLAFHVVHAVTANRWEFQGGKWAQGFLLLGTQVPLFFAACYYAYHEGVFSRQLVSPVYIGLGALLGHLIFVLSLLITHGSLEDSRSHLFGFGDLWRFTVENPVVLYRFITVGVAEEIIWRAAAQPILIEATGNAALGIIVTAILFAVVHKHFFRNSLTVSFEFLIFSLLVGVLYFWTGSLILVIVIHTVRDVEIAYLEYLIKVDELDGDEEAAVREIERMYMPKRPEMS